MFEREFPNLEVHSTSDNTRLSTSFPNSPIHKGAANDITNFSREGVRTWFQDNVLSNAAQSDNEDYGTIDMNFSSGDASATDAPPKLDGVAAASAGGVDVGPAGKPGSHFGPNLASSTDPNKPFDHASLGGPITVSLSNNFGSGFGTRLTPLAGTKQISGQKIKELDFGSSAPQVTTEDDGSGSGG